MVSQFFSTSRRRTMYTGCRSIAATAVHVLPALFAYGVLSESYASLPKRFGKRLKIKFSFALEMPSHLVAVAVLHLDYTFCRRLRGQIYGNKVQRRSGSAGMSSCVGLFYSFFKICVAQAQGSGYFIEWMILTQHHCCCPQFFRNSASVLLGFAPIGKSGLNFREGRGEK